MKKQSQALPASPAIFSKRFIFKVLFYVIVIGVLMIMVSSSYNFFYTSSVTSCNYSVNFWSTVGMLFLVAGAAAMSGAFLGFLFGLPKYNPNGGNPQRSTAIAFSDNLAQVSDWLTKIIVGVGLTQLTSMPHYLAKIADYVTVHSNVLLHANQVISVILYFIFCGFSAGYLWTTIYYPPIMKEIYNAVSDDRLDKFEQESDDQKEAIRLVNEQMAKGVGQSDIPASQLEAAIGKLSETNKDYLFQLVDRVCYENADTNPRIVKRTIPIFQALINAGNKDQVFEYYAELGFAYMSVKSYKEAYEALMQAYKLRPAGTEDYEQIEHNLAESLIILHTNANGSYSMDASVKAQILDYLKVAVQNKRLEEHMNEANPDNMVIRNWLKDIGRDLASLKTS